MLYKEVYILLLNWNGWYDTIECLESLQKLNYLDYRIIVIDNGSTDGSMDKIKSWAAGKIPVESKYFDFDPSSKPVRWIEYDRQAAEAGGIPEQEADFKALRPDRKMVLIQTGENLGFGGGNNVGIRYAIKCGSDYIWLLNNDTVADRNSLSEMMNIYKTDEYIGFMGSKLLYYHQPDLIQSAGGGRLNFWTGLVHHYGWLENREKWKQPFYPQYITGASLLVRRSCIEETGLIDESFFLYGEETDWQIKASKKWCKYYCPGSIIYHREGSTAGHKSPDAEFYIARAVMRICIRYAPWTLPSVLIFNMLRVARRLITGHSSRAKAIIRGIIAGLRNQGGRISIM
jgi:GT2 family glycosyltransferase